MTSKKGRHHELSVFIDIRIPPVKWSVATAVPIECLATREGGVIYAALRGIDGGNDIVFSRPRHQLPVRFREVIPAAFTTPAEENEDEEALYVSTNALAMTELKKAKDRQDQKDHGRMRPLPYQAKRFKFPVLVARPLHSTDVKLKSPNCFDPSTAREKFLNLKHTGKGWRECLVSFLNEVGTFDSNQPEVTSSKHIRIVLPEEVWQAQAAVIEGMRSHAADWMRHERQSLLPRQIANPPYLAIHLRGALQAMRMEVTLDHLEHVQFRICANENCSLPFKAKRKDQEYHDSKCKDAAGRRAARKKAK